MRDYLLFQLYAPLSAWGDQAVGQERPTADHPSRSALLGLIAAALGIERYDQVKQQALNESCNFAIKLYAPGLTLCDFHTIQVPPENKKAKHLHTRKAELAVSKLGTMLSFRSYQQDSFSVVALWLSESSTYTLTQIHQALERPHFHLYLGRKSCPLAISLAPLGITAATFEQALDQYPIKYEAMRQWLKLDSKGSAQALRYYWEPKPSVETQLTPTYTVPRYDQPLDRKRWQFVSRMEQVVLIGKED